MKDGTTVVNIQVFLFFVVVVWQEGKEKVSL